MVRPKKESIKRKRLFGAVTYKDKVQTSDKLV